MEEVIFSPRGAQAHSRTLDLVRLAAAAVAVVSFTVVLGTLLLTGKVTPILGVGSLVFLNVLSAFAFVFGPFRSGRDGHPLGEEIASKAQAWMEMGDPALIFDSRGAVQFGNLAFQALQDSPSKKGHLLDLVEFLGGPGSQVEVRWLLQNVARHGSARGFEASVRAPGDGALILEGSASQLKGEGEPRYVLVWRDVTERSGRERSLAQVLKDVNARFTSQTSELANKVDELAQANKELQELDQMRSDLISLVSHQIRAPLTNMLGAVEGMQAGCPSPTSVCRRMFVVLRDQTARLNRLVRDVLSVAKLESGDLALQIEPLSLIPVLRQAVDEVGARGARSFHMPYAPILPLVMADKDRLTDVLVNLLDNADKYSPEGSEVRIEVRPTETEVIVSVIDSGPGLTDDDLSRVFDKYYRAETGDAQRAYGYGLGLYVCHRLIEAQRGRIWARRRPEGGASFSFSLPVSES